VFLYAAPIGALAFCLTFLLKEVPLRETTRAVDPADRTAPTSVPATRNSAQEMERALLALFGRERRAEVYRGLCEAAGVQVSPRGCWLLYRVADNGPITKEALAQVLGISVADLNDRLADLVAAGYVTFAGDGAPTSTGAAREGAGGERAPAAAAGDGATLVLTPAGEQAAGRLAEAREAGIDRLMTGWEPDSNLELRQLLGRITSRLVATDDPPDREAAGRTAA
jgi:DNA-binding MarR family transcriptional regulator